MTVFISYSNVDEQVAMRFREVLLANSVDVWIDQLSILPGQRWQETIEVAIRSCSHQIVLLSENAIDSPEVEAEWGLALSCNKIVIPIMLDEVGVPYRMRSIQSLSLPALGFEQVLSRLLCVLPKEKSPKHFVATANRSGITDEYAVFKVYDNYGGSKMVLMRVGAYSCIGELLDDLFIHYIADSVSPYSYGSEWILAGEPFRELLVVPWEWVQSPGKAVTQIAPSWSNTTATAKLTIMPRTSWEIVTKEGYTSSMFSGMVKLPYAVATNNKKVAHLLLTDAKAISALYHEGVLTKQPFAETNPDDYSYRYVFEDWLNEGLSNTLITDSGKEMSNQLETMFAGRLRRLGKL